MNNLTLFKFDENEIRMTIVDGEPWFVGIDIAKILGYTNLLKALIDHVDEEDKIQGDGVTIRDLIGREQSPTFINESGVYSLIFGSQLESAKAFKKWVTHEVLPTIRKEGFYSTLTTEKLVEILTEKQRGDAKFIDGIDKPAIKRRLLEEQREERIPKLRQAWIDFFVHGRIPEVDAYKSIRLIRSNDPPLYHKYRDRFERDVRNHSKGHIIEF